MTKNQLLVKQQENNINIFMKTILEYLLSNKDKGRDKRPEFPKSFITDDIITFLECNDYVEIKELTDNIDKAYEKIQENIKHNNIFCTLNEEYNVVIVRFCNQGEISEKKSNILYFNI